MPSSEGTLIDPDQACLSKFQRRQKLRVAPHITGVRLFYNKRDARFSERSDYLDRDIEETVAEIDFQLFSPGDAFDPSGMGFAPDRPRRVITNTETAARRRQNGREYKPRPYVT